MSVALGTTNLPSPREVRWIWLLILLVILIANHAFGQESAVVVECKAHAHRIVPPMPTNLKDKAAWKVFNAKRAEAEKQSARCEADPKFAQAQAALETEQAAKDCLKTGCAAQFAKPPQVPKPNDQRK